jgi:hypothetical protein
MDKRSLLFTALALAMACRCAPALAEEGSDQHVAPGIHEVDDEELADMRGRYVAGDNTVVWFGVEMITTWQTNNGQTLQGTLTLSLDFSKNPNQPQVRFVPTVTIATISNATPAPASANVSRNVQSAGLANVSGMTQSVQIAGDNNAVANVTSLNIQQGGSAPTSAPSTGSNTLASTPSASASPGTGDTAPSTGTDLAVTGSTVTASSPSNSATPANSRTSSSNTVAATVAASTGNMPSAVTSDTGRSTPNGRVASVGDASASSTYDKDSAQLTLSVIGHGTASQWIRPGSVGQTIALTTDNQVVTNQMIVSMVTQSSSAASSQLAHSLAQSINFNRSNR